MIRLKFTAVLLVILCSAAAATEPPLDAVVTIWADNHFFGTGFFISGDGRILTAYHVIHGAHQISVLHQGDSYNNVLVESYAPDRDLAILRVLDWKKPISYLKLAYKLPPGAADEHLMILGNGASIENQRIQARMITKGLRNSQEIRGDHGERVFNLDNVHVIYLDADTNDGLSGGPVVSSAGVIGVLSGSLSQGGSISWAIPSEYAQPQVMVQVNKRPEEISAWPPFNLMSEGRRNVRAAVVVSPDVASVIDRYYHAVARSTADAERIPALAAETLVYVKLVRTVAEHGTTVDDGLVNLFTTNAEVLKQVVSEWNQDRSVVGNCILELGMKVLDLYQSVPATQQNLATFERFFKFMVANNAELKEQTETVLQRDKANVSRIMELAAKQSHKEVTAEQQLSVSIELENLYGNFTSLDFRRMTVSEARLYERLGSQIQLLMTSRLESKEADWKFSSERGFTIAFPAGWELMIYPLATTLLRGIGLEMLEENTSFGHKVGGDFEAMLKNETLINDPGNPWIVSLKVFTRPSLGPVGPLTEDEREIISAANQREGFREVEIEREMLNGNWVTMYRRTFDDKESGKPAVDYSADIHGTHGTLTLKFFMPATHAASVIPSCHRVLETIEYK